MKNSKLFSIIMVLNITSALMSSYDENHDANIKAAKAILSSIVPCASPVRLIHEASQTNNSYRLREIEKKLSHTTAKSFLALIPLALCVAARKPLHSSPCPKLELFFATHFVGVVPGGFGMLFAHKKSNGEI